MAMDKLLEHRNGSSNPMAKCYLMVARDVADWDEDSNTYNASIELYKHDSKIVGVCDVKDLIIEEIKKFLEEKGYDENQVEIIYGELCLFLDDRIALMHKQGTKKRDCTTDGRFFGACFSVLSRKMERCSIDDHSSILQRPRR